MSNLLAGKDTAGATAWNRAHTIPLHGKAAIEPRRKKLPIGRPPALASFLRGCDRFKRACKGNVRSTGTSLHSSLTRPLQRVTLRAAVNFSQGKGSGAWMKWGRYLERDGANRDRSGFGAESDRMPLELMLRGWQMDGDEKIYKLVVNPELPLPDPKRFARDLLRALEYDNAVAVQWAAAVHWNTRSQIPHLHIGIRSVARDGAKLVLSRQYLYHALRVRAQEAATAQLGYREPARDRAQARENTRQVEPERGRANAKSRGR